MQQIKPEVIGYNRVYTSGKIGAVLFSLRGIISASKRIRDDYCTHPNGKQKFRPVYKKD